MNEKEAVDLAPEPATGATDQPTAALASESESVPASEENVIGMVGKRLVLEQEERAEADNDLTISEGLAGDGMCVSKKNNHAEADDFNVHATSNNRGASGGVQSDRDDDDQSIPPPMPSLARNSADRPPATPGAVSYGANGQVVPTGADNHRDSFTNPEPEAAPAPASLHDNNGLAVANPVPHEDEHPPDLPRAEQHDEEAAAKQKAENAKKFKRNILVGVIILTGIIALVVGFTVPSKDPSPATTVAPTNSPTPAPTSLEDSVLSLFPDRTIQAIFKEPDSSQAMAFQWLMEESDILPSLNQERVLQRFVMATLFFATNGDAWVVNDNWLNHSVHECLWFSDFRDRYYEITLEPNTWVLDDSMVYPCEREPSAFASGVQGNEVEQGGGILKHLWLDRNGLKGSIPPALYLLTELRSISIDFADVPGPISPNIGQLSNLEIFYALVCGLTGTIPDTLSNLINLQQFGLGFNHITGTVPHALWKLSNLTNVLVADNLHTGTIPTELGPKLQELFLEFNPMTGTIPTELGNLSLLTSLWLGSMSLSGTIPSEFAKLTAMQLLELHSSGLTGTLPDWLGTLPFIQNLALNNNYFSGTITTTLGMLLMNHTSLFKYRGFIVGLHLDNNLLQGTIPTELGLLEIFDSIRLNNNSLTGTIPTELGRLSGVEELFLQGNALTGTVPEELVNVGKNNEVLVMLDENDLSGIIPDELCPLNPSNISLSFDCSEQLCGCDCNCSIAT